MGIKDTPLWFKKGNIYQINPRTFTKEGTLASVTKELGFLQSLGIKIIYLCPIFKEDDAQTNWSRRQTASNTNNPKNPYRMNDYFEIDEEYGNINDLRHLIEEAHKLDMRVFLDLVYLHIGINAQVIKEHPDFVKRNSDGDIELGGWNFPLLNFENMGLCEYLWSNMTYYIGALCVDGFRCDVGDRVPLEFWIEGKRRIRAIKSDAVMINEGIEAQHLKECFDANYSFPWHEAIYGVLSNDAPAAKLHEQYNEEQAEYADFGVLIRDIDNHDTVTDWPQRAELVAGHNGMEAAIALNYIIDGVPMIYCGNELADTAKLSMFANRFYMGDFEVTDRNNKSESHSIRRQEVITKLNALKAESDILCFGKTRWLHNSCEEKIVSFERVYGEEKIIYIGNLSNQTMSVVVDEACLKNFELLIESEDAPKIEKENQIHMSGFSYMVIKQ